jgi:hypothetical protein
MDFDNEQSLMLWLCAGNRITAFNGDIIGYKDKVLYNFTRKTKVIWNLEKSHTYKKLLV